MCILCVAIPFVLVTLAPRFITAAEVNLFFLLETILGPIWVWLVIKETAQSRNNYWRNYNLTYHSYTFFSCLKKKHNKKLTTCFFT